ncbi:hypothetical protein Pan97_28040 [Bremerella volcania]|uniref:Putative glutamine amidotransferase domain-containing protein n=1 Tax=Bremerella volcania TaxID=2527984 RepID=A0A518C972_9BACT|nr:glutamine amidotransferase [Bremerella volcania]QDU75762.1 hypothetical protein Pan97_28040 [Bremerella volcania]
MNDWVQDQWLLEWPNVWAAQQWIVPASVIGAGLFVLILWAYRSIQAPLIVKLACAAAKTLAVILLAALLVEPMRSETKPVPGANLFVVLADRSQSLQVIDPGESNTRAELLKKRLDRQAPWQVRLGQEFDVRRYEFADRLSPVADFHDYQADGRGSAIVASLDSIADRFAGRPIAGVLLLTDGNATDLTEEAIDWSKYPPIFPVQIGADEPATDIRVSRVAASQTNFEASPVTVTADVAVTGFPGESIVVELVDEQGELVETQTVPQVNDGQSFTARFQIKPGERGVLFYQVRAYAQSQKGLFDDPSKSSEATLLNNSRTVMVNRGHGPYKVLYVSGRPNWEFKFLNRSLAEDDEVELHGLIRIAKKEPRFQFREKDSNANRIFTNTDDEAKEQVEQYDEPVLLRVGKLEPGELSGGFPKSADELFPYHAIILDDLEADFFTQQQKSLIQEFVSLRGGGLLMLGGGESFAEGKYLRSPIGEVLPVYLNGVSPRAGASELSLALTREGLLEPWVRVRTTQQEELQRLKEMPSLRILNEVGALKPGASELLSVVSATGESRPGLVTQRFGKGRTAAFLIGDLWRWKLHASSHDNDDFERTWRQTIRWLIADVPQRVRVETIAKKDGPTHPLEVAVQVNDENYQPLDNAGVAIEVTTPGDELLRLKAEPKDAVSGQYGSRYVSRIDGMYRASVIANNPDGSEIDRIETGWVADPAAEEFANLRPNVNFLRSIAQQSGGELVRLNQLDSFVNTLSDREIPIAEPMVRSVWHTWGVFLLAIGLLSMEWGLRRWKGLA